MPVVLVPGREGVGDPEPELHRKTMDQEDAGGD